MAPLAQFFFARPIPRRRESLQTIFTVMKCKPSNYSENWTITTLNFAFKEYFLTLKAQKCLHCLTCNCSNALAIRCTFKVVRWNRLRSHIVLQFKKNWIRHNSVCDVMSIRTQRKKSNNAGDWRQRWKKICLSCWLKIQLEILFISRVKMRIWIARLTLY